MTRFYPDGLRAWLGPRYPHLLTEPRPVPHEGAGDFYARYERWWQEALERWREWQDESEDSLPQMR